METERPADRWYAGTASQSACVGCPNQQLCSSGEAAKPDPAIVHIAERSSTVIFLETCGQNKVFYDEFSGRIALRPLLNSTGSALVCELHAAQVHSLPI